MVNDAITAPGPKIASQRSGFAERRAGGNGGEPDSSGCDGEDTTRNYYAPTNR